MALLELEFYTMCTSGGDGSVSAHIFADKDLAYEAEECELAMSGEGWGEPSVQKHSIFFDTDKKEFIIEDGYMVTRTEKWIKLGRPSHVDYTELDED